MIPDPTDPCWQRAITSEKDLAGAALATKILLTRLRREAKSDPGSLKAKISELHSYFASNSFAAGDIALF